MKYRVPAHVHFRSIHDEVVILDTRTDTYLGLNDTAAAAWSVLSSGGSSETAIEELTTRFDVSPDVATSDVVALIRDLLDRELLHPVSK